MINKVEPTEFKTRCSASPLLQSRHTAILVNAGAKSIKDRGSLDLSFGLDVCRCHTLNRQASKYEQQSDPGRNVDVLTNKYMH